MYRTITRINALMIHIIYILSAAVAAIKRFNQVALVNLWQPFIYPLKHNYIHIVTIIMLVTHLSINSISQTRRFWNGLYAHCLLWYLKGFLNTTTWSHKSYVSSICQYVIEQSWLKQTEKKCCGIIYLSNDA